MPESLELLLLACGGGFGVFLLKLYEAKRSNKKDTTDAWKEIATRESKKLEELEKRVSLLETMTLEKDAYIKRLEIVIIRAGLELPLDDNMTGPPERAKSNKILELMNKRRNGNG